MMNPIRRIGRSAAALVLIILLVIGTAGAVEKVGTTSMQLLKIPVGVRGIAMGNAMVATVNDAEAVWWNPAALTEIKKNQAQVSLINMPADIHLMSGVLAKAWDDYSAVSLHVINLYTGPMKERTYYQPEGTGRDFLAWDLVLGGSYARKLTDRFSLGGNLRYLHSKLEEESYDGAAVDLGTLYKTGLRSMRLGMCIQNLGPNVKYSGSYWDYRNRSQNNDQLVQQNFEDASLPTIFRLGVAFNVFEMFGLKKAADFDADAAAQMDHPNDNRERLNIGAEGRYKGMLYLRAGGKFAYDEESFALGFGLRVPITGGARVHVDYAYSHMGRFSEAASDFADQPHRFAVGFEW
jgi:long-subunit fatty acid transport protein